MLGVFVWPGAARGAAVHFETGGALEGKLLEANAVYYRVRTDLGEVRVARDQVVRVEHAASLVERYQRRAGRAEATADAQYELAEWCRPRGLLVEQRAHVWRALRLDAEHAAARRALGYVKVGEVWVDGRAEVPRRPPKHGMNQARIEAAIQANWEKRIGEIVRKNLSREHATLNATGAAALQAITDPLAAGPLFAVLVEARHAVARAALVDALGRLNSDEATEYLVVAALEDAEASIRQQATAALAARPHRHAIQILRKALADESERLVANAATVLAALEDQTSIPALIDVLTARKKRLVEVPYQARRRYVTERAWGSLGNRYAWVPLVNWIDSSGVGLSPLELWDRLPGATVAFWAAPISRQTTLERREVTIYFSEVRDALVTLTGQDFGFDQEAWRAWRRAQEE